MPVMRRFAVPLLCLAAAACTSAYDRNLTSAMKGYERLQLGMSHEDACWYGGFAPPPADRAYGSYATDFGRTFSKKELTLRFYVREGKLVRVVLVKPKYVGSARRDDEGEVLMEQGVTEAELAAMPQQ